jgi:hypothetical protein
MKRLLKWTGGVLLGLAIVGGTAHAATSTEAHEDGNCAVCNFIGCLHAAVFEAFHGDS